MKSILRITFFCIISWCAGVLVAQAQSLEWEPMDRAQEKAADSGKKVMLFAEAEWCGYCKRMHEEVFPRPEVQDSLQKYIHPVRLDIESDEQIVLNGREYSHQMLARKFQITSTPTLLFFDAEGELIGAQPGFLPADIFSGLLAYVGTDKVDQMPFKEYLEINNIDAD